MSSPSPQQVPPQPMSPPSQLTPPSQLPPQPLSPATQDSLTSLPSPQHPPESTLTKDNLDQLESTPALKKKLKTPSIQSDDLRLTT